MKILKEPDANANNANANNDKPSLLNNLSQSPRKKFAEWTMKRQK